MAPAMTDITIENSFLHVQYRNKIIILLSEAVIVEICFRGMIFYLSLYVKLLLNYKYYKPVSKKCIWRVRSYYLK